jgi:pSer/pThr/pTyr-binding forkhead associated (FHA) protein
MFGAYMWKLSIEDDQGQSTVVQLVRSEYTIGRTEENAIRLTERNISRHHARLFKQGPAWFIDDQGSYNGCYVNNERVVGHQPIAPNDLIQLGDYRLELLVDYPEVETVPQTAPTAAPNETLSTTLSLAAQTDRLVMVVGPTPGREYTLTHTQQRIGRGEECAICVNHSSVSRWHADLNFAGDGRYEIVDHGSANGIRINGVDLARGLLDSHDLIELGDVVLKFIPEGQLYRPTAEESRQLATLLGVNVDGPPPSTFERLGYVWKSMSKATRFGTTLLALVVVVLFTLVVVNRRNTPVSTSVAASSASEPLINTLKNAQAHFDRSEFEQGHRLLQTIPESSNLRQDPTYRVLEQKWADNLLSRAETANDEERQKLLETVSQTPTVDSVTRMKAADRLAQLKTENVGADALPKSPPPISSDTLTRVEELNSEAHAKPVAIVDPTPQQPMAVSNKGNRATANTPAQTPTVATTKATQGAGSAYRGASSNTEPNATALAISGDLDSVRAARDALKRKVAEGTATDKDKRLLRATCRQLGDSSCSR